VDLASIQSCPQRSPVLVTCGKSGVWYVVCVGSPPVLIGHVLKEAGVVSGLFYFPAPYAHPCEYASSRFKISGACESLCEAMRAFPRKKCGSGGPGQVRPISGVVTVAAGRFGIANDGGKALYVWKMNPVPWFKHLITERASAGALQNQLSLANERKLRLEAQVVILTANVTRLEEENAVLEAKVSELQLLMEDANKQIKIFDEMKKKYPQMVR
jgi:hypothetical protein